jgi:hypothetical protein
MIRISESWKSEFSLGESTTDIDYTGKFAPLLFDGGTNRTSQPTSHRILRGYHILTDHSSEVRNGTGLGQPYHFGTILGQLLSTQTVPLRVFHTVLFPCEYGPYQLSRSRERTVPVTQHLISCIIRYTISQGYANRTVMCLLYRSL